MSGRGNPRAIISPLLKRYDALRLGLLWLGLAVMTGCATLDDLGNTLGTQVVGHGQTLVLSWDEQHPISPQLQRDRRIRLRADYMVEGKPVSQLLSFSAGGPERRATFALPNRLKAVPDGEVCMYFQLSSGLRTLPVRSASSSQGDTAGFHYTGWELWVRNTMRMQRAEGELNALKREQPRIQQQVAEAEKSLARQGLKSPRDCARALPAEQLLKRPFDVVKAKQHEAISRKICVARAIELSRVVKRSLRDLVARHVTGGASTSFRRGQAQSFLKDWADWGSKVFSEMKAGQYRPEVGSRNDLLPTGSALNDLLKKLRSGQSLRTSQMDALVGGVLDAYQGCRTDARKQLKTKLDAWQKAVREKPERDRQYREFVAEDCQRKFRDYATLKNHAAESKQRSDAQQVRLTKLQGELHATLPAGKQVLNLQACSMSSEITRGTPAPSPRERVPSRRRRRLVP